MIFENRFLKNSIVVSQNQIIQKNNFIRKWVKIACLAQWTAHRTSNPGVLGSSPRSGIFEHNYIELEIDMSTVCRQTQISTKKINIVLAFYIYKKQCVL